ncbi:phosphatase PAP2 family protein [Polluticoccus soli]|uniref:phosphatase PAP2 family protein n=1 Tax=Polluticoccus soli TaxID=3034150 RepID=UPI0023E130E9|nr:phosphatase PAP2 family protein [Flavipsychrobacter sp. JY13-12]
MRRLMSLMLCICFSSQFAIAQSQDLAASFPEKNKESILFSDEKKTEVAVDVAPQKREEGIKPRSFIMPATLIAAGAFTLVNEVKGINEFGKTTMWRDGYQDRMKIDNYTIGLPAVAVYGLNLAGIKGQHGYLDATALLFMSSAISNGVVFGTKHVTGIPRPDGSDNLSFPSGHTAQAFVAAEFMRQEYKDVSPWYGAAGYAVAIGSGMLRMYHDKHWLGDVVAGAGVGILSTRVSYWLYPKIKEALFKNSKSNMIVAPVVSKGGGLGASLVYTF